MRRLLLVSLLSAALAGPATGVAATGILAVGDLGETDPPLGAAIQRFEERRPAEVLITLGDNDYTASPATFLRNWQESFGWLSAAGVRVAGTLGNHDVGVEGGRYEFGLLGMPSAYYTRRAGDVELFLLDSNAVGPVQTAWLRRALAASRARWKIAAFHHPAYTCGAYRSHRSVAAEWVPLFERYGVQLVLSGHDHNYQRFAPRRGVTYLVHGGGGARLYALTSCPAGYPRQVFARSTHGFLYLRAGRASLRGFAVTPAGRVIDRFTVYP